jgi:hypothetical protein
LADTQEFVELTHGIEENEEASKNEDTGVEAIAADIAVATAELAAMNKKKKRKRVSYAKKQLKAKFTLYLKSSKLPDLQIAFPCILSVVPFKPSVVASLDGCCHHCFKLKHIVLKCS